MDDLERLARALAKADGYAIRARAKKIDEDRKAGLIVERHRRFQTIVVSKAIVGHHIRTNRWGMGPTTCLRCGQDISKVPVCPLYEPKEAEG